jgi:Bacterial Ig-like domain (group 2).
MDNILRAIQKASWFHQTGKLVAVAASSGAALVTLFSALYSYGVIGKAESHQSIGNLGAAWVGLRPTVDTAAAIGDTTHFAATIADKNGSILVGARPTWTTGDSSVATVLPDGSVIALGPGVTTVSVVVGRLVAHSQILVRQRVTSVEVARTSGDSVVVVHEGIRLPLHARALDARGHAIAGLAVAWQIDDSSVAALDPDGALTGRDMGRTVVTANIGGVSGRSGVSVVSTAAAIAFVAGSSQRALAGSALPQPIVVRATNRRGEPTAGQAVSFRLRDGEGSVSPSTAITDADGRARAVWILGDYPGRQTLLASVEKLDSALAVIAEAEPVAENTRVFAVLEHLTGQESNSPTRQRFALPTPPAARSRMCPCAGRRLTAERWRRLRTVQTPWASLAHDGRLPGRPERNDFVPRS